jgi:8-oxo-dGTP diphosphatase
MNVICVAAALIEQNGKILFVKRSRGELKGLWEFPGGKIEKGETPEMAVVREIKEELDLEIKPEKTVGTYIHNYSFAKIKLTLLKCQILNKNNLIKLDKSHSESKWVNPKNNELDKTPLDKNIVSWIKW